jgi:hypothetical protein
MYVSFSSPTSYQRLIAWIRVNCSRRLQLANPNELLAVQQQRPYVPPDVLPLGRVVADGLI